MLKMDVTFVVDGVHYVNISTEVPIIQTSQSLWLKSAEYQDILQHDIEPSEAAGDRSQMMKSSDDLLQTVNFDSHSFNFPSHDTTLRTGEVQSDSTGTVSSIESGDLLPRTTDGSLFPSNTRMVANTMLFTDNIASDLEHRYVSKTHFTDSADKPASHRSAARKDTGNVSTSNVPVGGLHISATASPLISAMLNSSSTVASRVQAVSHKSAVQVGNTTLLSGFQFTTVKEAVSHSSSSEFQYFGDYTSAAVKPASNLPVHGTLIDAGEASVSTASAVSVTTVLSLSIGIMLGICVILVVAVGIILVIRHQRKLCIVQTACAAVQNDKRFLPDKMYVTGLDYAPVKRRPSQAGSMNGLDEALLLPHEQAVHSMSVGSCLSLADGDSTFDELNQLVRIDVDMSSLLQLVQNSRDSESAEADDAVGYSESVRHCSDDLTHLVPVPDDVVLPTELRGSVTRRPSFHEYDPVYVPRHDAAAMARRIDNETSYVRTLQSQRPSCSPYEEVFYGIRPVLLVEQSPVQVHRLPAVPPRTSSIDQSRLQNATNSRLIIAERITSSATAASNDHVEFTYQPGTIAEDASNCPYETIVIHNPT